MSLEGFDMWMGERPWCRVWRLCVVRARLVWVGVGLGCAPVVEGPVLCDLWCLWSYVVAWFVYLCGLACVVV